MCIMAKDMNYDRDLAGLFQQSYGEAVRAARNLAVSIKRTACLFPLSAAAMAQLDDEALERLDAFRVRYTQLQDVLAGKVFRALLHLEEESADSMLDTLNRLVKNSAGVVWRALRTSGRGKIPHLLFWDWSCAAKTFVRTPCSAT